jgi:TonB family protein
MDPFEFPQLKLDGSRDQSPCRKSTAGVLGVALGAFGLHRFYLGYRWVPVLQFTLTLLTAGLAGLWGTCEGLMILTGRFGRDAYGRPLRSARLAYVPAGRPCGAVTQYQHSRSSPWLLTVMIFFFPLTNSVVLAAFWTLAGWSLPAMLADIPALIPPPAGENWVAPDQPVALVVEVIARDEVQQQPTSQQSPVLLELVRPAWQEEVVVPVTVPMELATSGTARLPSRLVASWSRPPVDDPVTEVRIGSQPVERAEVQDPRDELLLQIQETSTGMEVAFQKRSTQTPKMPQTKIAQQVPQQAVAGGSIATPGVSQQPIVRPVYSPSPEYPAEALAKRQQGLVKIQIAIDPKGTVLSARVVQTSNNGSLDAAAIKAVRQWRFMVTAKQSPKRPVEVIVPIRFRIEMP